MWELSIAGLSLFGSVFLWSMNQRAAAHDRQRQEYAKALALVFKWQELPYRILRRDRSSPDHTMYQLFHNLQEDFAFCDAWIAVESKEVWAAYRALVTATKQEVMPHLQAAWNSEPPESPNVGNKYPSDIESEKTRYVEAVRAHFGWRSRLRSRRKH